MRSVKLMHRFSDILLNELFVIPNNPKPSLIRMAVPSVESPSIFTFDHLDGP